MQIEFSELGNHSVDVCIVGCGAAGLSMAQRLVRQGYRVALCEGGDHEYSERSQEIYAGESLGDPYIPLVSARLRYFGGSTNHWGGICRSLDTYDFVAKPAAPATTAWPIGREALEPYYAEAADILGVVPIPPDSDIPGTGLKRIHFSAPPPTRLKPKYTAFVQNAEALAYCPTANLWGLQTSQGKVTRAVFRDYAGNERRVSAHYFVLACGGIENSRLLLWCNRQADGQLVKHPETLGRYWMDHPHATIGRALFLDPARFGLDLDHTAFLAPTPDSIAERRILNCGLRLHRMGDEDTEQLIDDLAFAAPALGRQLKDKALGKRLMCGALLRAAWEQEPHPESRIELDTATDKLGMPRARLIWRKTPLDARTVRDSTLLLGDYLRDQNAGRLQLAPWLANEAVEAIEFPADGEIAGRHHMGGTRMSLTSDQGIVDSDCKVFGQDNFYIAGSSVFPSAGHANPTLTLTQLALRLSAHLERRLGQRI
ncbi:GMC oxidoreductase [Modicisalibacter xianhensis]|uniref:Choline dehydrogenase n=1 Tax=Modicisalibacter xianhensis TaxID=442341 RepID=A0A1I3D3P3_9GAMM|nr:GMC family oxidoreductase [Halomonas xianhensis]SFH81286.1 Choline dehydrogenase [Halomonas xianhensis]